MNNETKAGAGTCTGEPPCSVRADFIAWRESLYGGIGNSRNNAPDADPGSFESPWTNREWEAWKAAHRVYAPNSVLGQSGDAK
jgi:hypothetical protein